MEKNIPRRRFKEFVGSGDWEEKKLGEVAETFSGGTPTVGNLSYYGGKIPFIRSGEIDSDKTKLFITEKGLKNSSAKNIKKGNILYALYGATSGEVSISKINGAINQAILAIIPSKGYNNKFIVEWLRFNKYKIINTYLQGGQGNLSSRIIKSIVIKFPSLAEQEKIGNFFQKLDRLIEVNREKLDKLKASKSAYLTEMFPGEGEDRPRRRFQGFTGEWEEKKIRDIFRITRGNVLATTMTSKQKSDYYCYPVYSSQTLNNGLMGYYNDYLYKDSITWTTDGANAGTVKYRSGKFYCTNVCGVLLSNEGYSNKMVAEVLNKIAWQYVSKVGNPKLMNNIMGEIIIKLPSLAEQEKIGNFFQKLDDQIGLQEEKLEKLEKMKKAYLAEMFV